MYPAIYPAVAASPACVALLKSGAPIEADKSYTVAGWASVNQNVEGPPIWEVVERYVADRKTIKVEPNDAIKVTGA